jgi:hypothetical protein
MFINRLTNLASLAVDLQCTNIVLGGPRQRKISKKRQNNAYYTENFFANCQAILNILRAFGLNLSIEHNTRQQGADFMNNLDSCVQLIIALRSAGYGNVGLNLDTKCFSQEFGAECDIAETCASLCNRALITSIQVSYCFLTSNRKNLNKDISFIKELETQAGVPVSLEEFGLNPNSLDHFISLWQS